MSEAMLGMKSPVLLVLNFYPWRTAGFCFIFLNFSPLSVNLGTCAHFFLSLVTSFGAAIKVSRMLRRVVDREETNRTQPARR